jgi:hypothetical protein
MALSGRLVASVRASRLTAARLTAAVAATAAAPVSDQPVATLPEPRLASCQVSSRGQRGDYPTVDRAHSDRQSCTHAVATTQALT